MVSLRFKYTDEVDQDGDDECGTYHGGSIHTADAPSIPRVDRGGDRGLQGTHQRQRD